MWAAPRDDHNRFFIALMAALVALAWLALWLWGRSPNGLFYGHHGTFTRGGSFALVFIIGWTVMVVAMMLPTSLPLITLFRTIARQRQDRASLVALLIAGYIGTWTLFGVVVYLGGMVLQQLVWQSGWLGANAWVLGAGTITLAGLYQFTPLKYKCLEKCRSPLSFVMEHWRGSRERSRAFRLGVHHGLFCVGCCWSLMLLMFVVGVGSLGWMLALGAVMAVEKNVPWGSKISAPLGVTLVGCGLILGAMPALQSFGATSTKIALVPSSHSGASGNATLADTAGGVEVRLDVRGLPDPGATHLAHIHPGSCAGEAAGGVGDHVHGHHSSVEEIEHPLAPIVSNAGGRGSSATVIKRVTVVDLFSGDDFYINVHEESPGSEALPDSIVCSDLREAGRQ